MHFIKRVDDNHRILTDPKFSHDYNFLKLSPSDARDLHNIVTSEIKICSEVLDNYKHTINADLLKHYQQELEAHKLSVEVIMEEYNKTMTE